MRRSLPQTHESIPLVTINLGLEAKSTALAPTRRVLLLDDRNDFRNILREYLLSCSYQVTSAQSGIEGLRAIMKRPFDIIICDMMMPKMGGEMFYWAVIRARPATRHRFIFFTGHKNNPQIDFFFRRIDARVIFKPFKLAALDSAISDVIRKAG